VGPGGRTAAPVHSDPSPTHTDLATMIPGPFRFPRLAAAAAVLLLAACGPADEVPPDERPATPPEAGPPAGMQHDMHGMEMPAGAMQRHADELDTATVQMREHVRDMRGRTPAEWHARMGEHARAVSGLLGLMDRQMREMDMGMGMDDEHMGEMMGMSGEEHRRMMEEMREVRSEAEALQTASEAEVARRMPEHLDRLERFVERMEHASAAMRAT
jgi:hypothetical protein